MLFCLTFLLTFLLALGMEFRNDAVRKLLKQHAVTLIHSENDDTKASLAERAIRTLRNRLARIFRARGSSKYWDVLENIVKSYNESEHRSHGLRPNEVNDKNSLHVFNTLYAKLLEQRFRKPIFKSGDCVRIALSKSVFEKGYAPNFTEEIFTIVKVILKRSYPVYQIESSSGEPILGKFYERELCLVK